MMTYFITFIACFVLFILGVVAYCGISELKFKYRQACIRKNPDKYIPDSACYEECE